MSDESKTNSASLFRNQIRVKVISYLGRKMNSVGTIFKHSLLLLLSVFLQQLPTKVTDLHATKILLQTSPRNLLLMQVPVIVWTKAKILFQVPYSGH